MKRRLNWISLSALCILSASCMKLPTISSPTSQYTITPGQAACYGSSSTLQANQAQATNGTADSGTTPAANTMEIEVGSTYPCSYGVNILCTSVTICPANHTSGASDCQSISNILVDTGSYGLRIFTSVLSTSLCNGMTQLTDTSGNPAAECVTFGTGADWGPVVKAQVQLGGESPVTVPIQLINADYSYMPATCPTPDTDPNSAGFNGILGIGPFKHDCGSTCSSSASNDDYFSCSGNTCNGIAMPLTDQVQNPVSLLSTDNDGVVVQLPSISGSTGASSEAGTMFLGIGTETNNSVTTGVNFYQAANAGQFPTMHTTIFNDNGDKYTYGDSTGATTAFIDSGSNAYFYPNPTSTDPDYVQTCSSGSGAGGFFCPTSTKSFAGENQGYLTSVIGSGAGGYIDTNATFSIANAVTLLGSGHYAFDNLGADIGVTGLDAFDWGLPFFYGKSVYVGINGQTANTKQTGGTVFGTGPFWGY